MPQYGLEDMSPMTAAPTPMICAHVCILQRQHIVMDHDTCGLNLCHGRSFSHCKRVGQGQAEKILLEQSAPLAQQLLVCFCARFFDLACTCLTLCAITERGLLRGGCRATGISPCARFHAWWDGSSVATYHQAHQHQNQSMNACTHAGTYKLA